MLNRRHFLGAAAASMLAPRVFAQAAQQKTAAAPSTSPSPRTKLQPFLHRDVKLTGGPLKEQFDAAFAFYMKLDEARILQPYRKAAGLPTDAEPLGGWYSPGDFVPGHALGQWVSALSRFADATGDAAPREKVERLVQGFGETLAAGKTSFYDGHRFKAYVFDKHVIGLTEAATLAGVAEANEVLRQATEQAVKYLPEKALTREEMRARPHKDISYTWDESYTAPEHLFLAHKAFGDERYLELAKRYLHDKPLFDPLAEGKNALVGQHAYSHMNALSSAARAYLVLGDEKYLRAAQNGWRMVHEQSYASGGWGPNEEFVEPGKGKLGESLKTSHNHFETPCGSYAHFKLARYLMRITGESSFGDSLERVLYNGILASKAPQPDGSAFYYSDYQAQSQKGYFREKWPCCSGTYPQVIADYLVSMYFHDDERQSLYVNLFAPSQVKWNDVTLTQTTDYPDSERVTFRVTVLHPKRFDLRIRIPAWANGAKLAVGGKEGPATPGEFASVDREWRDGDTVELTLPMTNRTEPVDEQHKDTVALVRGPVMYVAVDQPLRVPRSAIPDDLSKPISAGQVLFVPFWRVKDEAYTTYFTLG